MIHSEIEAVGWAILQALHEGVEDGPQSWSDLAEDQEKRIKRAAIAAIEAVSRVAPLALPSALDSPGAGSSSPRGTPSVSSQDRVRP